MIGILIFMIVSYSWANNLFDITVSDRSFASALENSHWGQSVSQLEDQPENFEFEVMLAEMCQK